MRIDISTEATTRSMIRKWKEKEKPDLEGVLEFRNHESRHQDAQRQVFRFCRSSLFRGRQRQDGQQRDPLNEALSRPVALPEINTDVLRGGRRQR
jgi:hypothetical protein